MKRVKIVFALLVLSCVIGIISCRKGMIPSWDTQILAPLIKTTLGINNLVTNTTITTNAADSSVTLVFTDSLYTLNLDSLLKIPDTTLVYSYPSPPNLNIAPGGALPLIQGTDSITQYNTGSVLLTNAIIQSGYVKFEVISYLTQPTDYTYTIPNATLNGNPLVPLSITVKVPAANGNTPGTNDTIYSLNGYHINFTGPSQNGNNLIITRINGIVDPHADTLKTANVIGNGITINATFYNIVPYYGQGDFQAPAKTFGPDNTNFSLFKNISGTLNLKDVKVNLTLENGFGVDASVKITQLSSINSHTGTSVNLSGSIINKNIDINRAIQTNNPALPVNSSIQNFSINPNNSNILQWIDNMPTSVGYALQVTTDPKPIVPGWSDFVYLGYGIKAYLNIAVPLSIAANNLTLEDTLPVNFGNSSQSRQIKSGTFTLYAANLFPFSATLQVYLLNNKMQVTDSLMNPPETIAAGDTNASGYVTTPENSVLTIPLSDSQANQLFTSKNIIIMARFNTGCTTCTPKKFSKIYDTYNLGIKLVGNFDYQVKG
ncbi:MAG: hypothetical protein ACLQQ4_12010 [Bacteroidia bacterium]